MIRIPRKIHYCWFGGNPLPDLAIKCMESWRKYCPTYEIIRWDESNCDMEANLFVQQAYKEKKWAFVSDYFRLKVIEEQGGIYLDTDVELLKPLDDLLTLDGYMGFELSKKSNNIGSGLGFGAIAQHPIIIKLRESYENITFIKPDGNLDLTPCPQRDTMVLIAQGLKQNDREQTIKNMTFFPSDYFSPIGYAGEKNFSARTYSIHHFHASWHPEKKGHLNSLRNSAATHALSLVSSAWITLKSSVIRLIVQLKNNLRP